MTIYIDSDHKCHVESAEGLRAFEVPFFEGKCKRFIEGYRYVPQGETWVREDGERFQGEMIAPHEDYAILEAAQAIFEELGGGGLDKVLAELTAAFEEGVNSI